MAEQTRENWGKREPYKSINGDVHQHYGHCHRQP